MSRIRTYLKLTAVLIVSAVAGCDNVEWGGVEFSIVPPAPKGAPAETGPTESDALPQGPLLYYVRTAPDRSTGTVTPVAEISGDSLLPIGPWQSPSETADRFITRYLPNGAELSLFHRGKRAGTLVVESAERPGADACRRLPIARGALRLAGPGRDADELLAMSRADAPEPRVAPGEETTPGSAVQAAAPALAEQMLRSRGAPPPPDWDRARVQLETFPVPGSGQPAFTTTYLVGDTLGPGLDDRGLSLHFLGLPRGQAGYDTAYVRYTPYREAGKAAPRTVDFLDWDGDGSVDLLLRVYGTDSAWFEAVSTVQGQWRRTFVDRCETPAADDDAGTPP